MITFPKPVTLPTRLAIESHLDGHSGGSVAFKPRNFRLRLIEAGLVELTANGHEISAAGYNAVGRPAPNQAWGTWTVAWRKVRGTTFSRAVNWAGTWAEAVEMAASVGELLGDRYQVYYTTTRAQELAEQREIAAGELGMDRAEDHGNIMVDSGLRVRIVDNGMLPAELLDREVENVTHAMRRADTAPGEIRTLADYRAMATHLQSVMSEWAWATLADKAATADARRTASYLNQRWARQEAPAERLEENDRAMAVADLAAIDAINDARDSMARARDAADAAALEADGGWGQPDGMLGATEAERGDLVAEAAAQGLVLNAAATSPAGEPVFTAPTADAEDEDESVCSDGYPEHLEEVVHQDADGTQWICRRCGAEGYEEAEAVESGEQDAQRPDGCAGCTYLPGPDYGTRVSSSPTCAVHGA